MPRVREGVLSSEMGAEYRASKEEGADLEVGAVDEKPIGVFSGERISTRRDARGSQTSGTVLERDRGFEPDQPRPDKYKDRRKGK